MKRCPQCNHLETDDALGFCRADGTVLISESGSAGVSAEIETRILPHRIDADINRPTAPTAVLPAQPSVTTGALAKPKRRRAAAIAIAIVVTAVVAGTAALVVNFYLSRRSPASIQSIAVMPFVNEGGNADIEYLSDGMTETLISSLSQLPNLNVKARSSVFRYKGKGTDPQTIGRELNVHAILNGRVVQRGQDLILHVELVDAQTENVLWAESYSRRMMNLVSLQSEIARDLSRKLKTKLSGSDEQKLTKNYTENAEAYQLYLKGRFAWNKRTEKDIQRAIEFFQQAIALDPAYALAYAGLADAYAVVAVISNPDPVLRREGVARGREAALKALSIDHNLPEAHTALGTILASFDYDFAGAEREYMRAIEINPNYADAHYWYAQLLSRLVRSEEASEEYLRALELEPLNLVYQANYGGHLAFVRRYEEAIIHLEKTLELDNNFGPTLGNLTNAYWLKGDYAKSVESLARELELRGFKQEAAIARDAFAKGGWEGYLRYMSSNDRPAYLSFNLIALCHIGLGEKDKAFAALNKSYENREALLTRLKVDPRFDQVRDNPRFKELLKKVGFPE